MGKTEDFIVHEKDYYGKIFSTITFAIDEVDGFLDKDTVKNRKYFSRLPILKRYMELLDSAKADEKSKGFLGNLFSGDKYIGILEDYKRDHSEELTQLETCSKCECLKCSATCKFDSCLGCKNGKHTSFCDHKKTAVYFFTNSEDSKINLVNNNTGENDRYLILAIVEDCENNKRYILIENLRDKERFILYYYPRISEDEYGEITNEDDFNYAASAYENVERV